MDAPKVIEFTLRIESTVAELTLIVENPDNCESIGNPLRFITFALIAPFTSN